MEIWRYLAHCRPCRLTPALSCVGRYLSTYYAKEVEVPKPQRDEYENDPTVVAMADVFVGKMGFVWNEKVGTVRVPTVVCWASVLSTRAFFGSSMEPRRRWHAKRIH